ncbi:MBL fold metallo-hydrolase [Natronomonas gomsonensis]|uniref:MBL fold metallo-hydrolase n=1 Tax=Natronomonas gomsonensis TaxID=1046043 RepID=UPI0015C0196E|nr:MBL fold metallo-hydrolase [Natronomonas gomsonensis]
MNSTDEWYDVEAVSDGTYRISEGPYYGMYLAAGTERSYLVDAGIGVGDLRALVEGLVDTPVTLLLTHWHWDHIGNAAQFDDVRIHERERSPDGRVALDGRSEEFLGRPANFLERWQAAGKALPDGFDADDYAIEAVENPTSLSGDETFDLGDRTLESLHLSGHSPGQLGFLDRQSGVLYGGDVIHVDEGLYVHLEGGDLRAYLETFERLCELRDAGGFETLLTSHNPPFVGAELAILDRLEDGLRRIIDGDADYEVVETDWGDARRYEFGGSVVFTEPTLS